ncbi:isocitrate lyase/phosphoenolpyruvate mutase family protein [Streptomyces sp. NPDC048638]|uniref:isocitrate lyase/PEP mutase family protein n=1 Tax=Streptomyces sp. NPDC048638 TaxID=3365580 RepID=UPI003711EF16
MSRPSRPNSLSRTSPPGPAAPATAFRALHRGGEPLVLPNAWDVASALALADAGFPAVGTTSLGVAAAHGEPDGQGLAGVRDATVALARRLGDRLPCPYTVDIEGGYGGDGDGAADRAADLVAELAAVGAAGINLEDGLPGGEGLQPAARQAELIVAVKERAPGVFLNARIDTHWLVDAPPPLSAALDRAETYLAAGADGIFVPGVVADDEMSALVSAVPAPLNILFAPGRHTVSRLADLGVRRISTGSLLFRTALGAALAAAESVRSGEGQSGEPGGAGVVEYAQVQRLLEAGQARCARPSRRAPAGRADRAG